MDSQQAAFEKFKAASRGGKSFSRSSRNGDDHSGFNDGPMPDLYSIHHGKVVKVEDYGAFVQIPGFKRNGLVFKNQASKHFTERISDVVSIGDSVWVKVTSVQDNKIALSMKHVNQGDGTDLDPNLVQFTDEQDKRRTHGGFVDKKPISVEDGGVFKKAVCKKCGATGHLASECFSGGEKFELLEEEDYEDSYAKRSFGGKEKEKDKEKDKKRKDRDEHKDKRKDKGRDSHRHRDRDSGDRHRDKDSGDRHRDRDSDRHRDRDRDRDRDGGGGDKRDHRDRHESSSQRKEKRRDRSRSASPRRRSDSSRVSKVESLGDALAVMRTHKKHRRNNDNSDESGDERKEKRRGEYRRRSRSRSPRRSRDSRQ